MERHLLEYLQHSILQGNQLPTPSSHTPAKNSSARSRAPFSMLGFCLTWSGKGLVQAVTSHTFCQFMYATALCTENSTSLELFQLLALKLFSSPASWCCLSLGWRGCHHFFLALWTSTHRHSLQSSGRISEERAERMEEPEGRGDVRFSGNRQPRKPWPYNSRDRL